MSLETLGSSAIMQPSACLPWQPDHAANAAQEHRSYTTWWDTILLSTADLDWPENMRADARRRLNRLVRSLRNGPKTRDWRSFCEDSG